MDTGRLVSVTREVFSRCSDMFWEQSRFQGKLIKSVEVTSLLKELDGSGESPVEVITLDGVPLSLNTLESKVADGDTFQVRIFPVRQPKAFVAQDLDDLLRNFDFCENLPPLYLVADCNYASFDSPSERPTKIGMYHHTLEFIEMLKDVAEYTEKSLRRLIFFGHKRRLEIDIVYKAADLPATEDVFIKLKAAFSNSPHVEVKKTLLAGALFEVAQNVSLAERFMTVLSKLKLLWEKFYADYQLYMSEFSFENEKEKLEERKREYLVNLNNVISGIQNQILAIPISLVLIGGQMKLVSGEVGTTQATSTLLANTAILAGALIFAVLMIILTRNQRTTLGAVKEEYENRQLRYKKELPSLFHDLQTAFVELDNRQRHVSHLLRFIDFLVYLGLIFAAVMFVLNYPAAKKMVYEILQRVIGLI